MKKFDLVWDSVVTKDTDAIKEGVTYNLNFADNWDPQLVKSFLVEEKEEALEELKKYTTQICPIPGGGFHVEEYFVVENEYDNVDGEFICGGDICAFSAMKIELWDIENNKVVKTFDNYQAAAKALEEYRETREWEVEPELCFL